MLKKLFFRFYLYEIKILKLKKRKIKENLKKGGKIFRHVFFYQMFQFTF